MTDENLGGRPRLFQSPEEMQDSIANYFLECKDNKLWPTVAGLTLHLGFSDRSSLIDYQERDEFFHTIKRAKLTIECALEQRLYEAAPAGAIFNLKNNFGWKDKTEQELSGADGGPIKTSNAFTFVAVGPDYEPTDQD